MRRSRVAAPSERVPPRVRSAEPVYFDGPEAFRAWLERHGATEQELLVGFHKRATGKPSMTWPQSVDEALCFGWIDGIRRSVDAERYTIRFTPRRPRSTWSLVNIARVKALVREGRMRPAGLTAFQARADERSAVYSYEQRRRAAFAPDRARRLREERAAWAWLEEQPPSYRRLVAHWVESAKREETRERRFASLLACCTEGKAVPPLQQVARRTRS